jgi:hypothetical protein
MVYTIPYRINLNKQLCNLLLLQMCQFIQIGTRLGLGREEHHILTLPNERQVSTSLQIETQWQAHLYAADATARQGCVRSINGDPQGPPNTPNTNFLNIKHLIFI